MTVLSDSNSVLAAQKIKKMIRESKNREQLATTKRYFERFKLMTSLSGLADEIQQEIIAQERVIFPECGLNNLTS